MKYLLAVVMSLIAIAAQAKTGDEVTSRSCSLAESFVINAYSALRMSNPMAFERIRSSINSGDANMRVGAVMANNFIAMHNAWAPQYEQWANQNARSWCNQYIGQVF